MPKVKAENLQAGDIVVFEWISGFWHTAIFIGKVSGRGEQHRMAHCEGATHGTALDPFQSSADEARNVYGFRLPNAKANALRKVLAVTRTWAPVLPSNQSTRYGTPRGSAILKVYDRDNPGQAPAFEYDALYRVFR